MIKKITLLLLICLSSFAHSFQLQKVVGDLKEPTDILFLASNPDSLLVTEKTGRLLFVNLTDKTQTTVHTFDVTSEVELGLLGITVHPNFATNGFLFVNYNPKEGELSTRISRFTLNLDLQKPTLSDEKIILEVAQPYKNHNAGQLAFGPDGYLYVGMGDGGSGGDPKGNGQNLKTLLGAMLRLNVDTSDDIPYSIPSDNPFVNNDAALDEIWAYGIRNPWRYTFHNEALIVADVGQSKLEEVNIVEKGKNYGWNIMEGDSCFKDEKQSCDKSKFEAPRITYPREDGMSITGGNVYTKGSVKALANRYVYADFIVGNIWSVKYPSFEDNRLELASGLNVSAFALDTDGELYFADFANGLIHQVVE